MPNLIVLQSPRLRLAILYSSVVGSILLLIGYATHRVLDRASTQIIDREMDLLGSSMSARLEKRLTVPGDLPPSIDREISGICRIRQSCYPNVQDSMLLKLIREDYHLQLLDLSGNPIAAIGEPPGRFPKPSSFTSFKTVKDQQGVPYHLHYTLLKTEQGVGWGYLQVGRSVAQFDAYMTGLHGLILWGIPSTMVIIGVASWWLAGVAMRPIYSAYGKIQQFTADASHELRTPIASTRAMLEVAITQFDRTDSSVDSSESRQTLVALQRQNDRLNRLAQDLFLLSQLDLSQQDSFGIRGSKQALEVICLNDLVEDLEEELAPLALQSQVELTSQIDRSKRLSVSGNSSQLYRLFSNLVTNAIQYTLPNGLIQIHLTHHRGYAFISVIDNGIGIAESDLPFLFDRFYRIKSDRSRQSGGAGLGLAIAKAIVQTHGGQIQVKSVAGVGSKFKIRLPLKSVTD
ncbi:MAG TPA: two-component sensor histidine kinase [Cyanobacteria bacterium UBA8553]|nr:two-component sensor histidine kinase [Cyanobacteria bacterium UBA8553]